MGYTRLPMRKQMLRIIFSAAGIALLAAAAAVLVYESSTYRPRIEREVQAITNLYVQLLPATLDFHDPQAAEQYLAALQFQPNVERVCVYESTGTWFAAYRKDLLIATCPQLIQRRSAQVYQQSRFELLAPIRREREIIGWLFVTYRLLPLYARLPQYGIMVGVVIFTLSVVSFLLWYALARYVTTPLNALARTAKHIATTYDYSIRVSKVGSDELAALTDALNLLLATTEESIRLRDDFLSIASHELKTPLTPIRTQLQLLEMLLQQKDRSDEWPEKLLRVTQLALKQVDRLTGLVDNLLDVSRITTGRLVLTRERTSLSAIVRESYERYVPEFERASTSFKASIEDNIEANIDVLRIEQVIANLLSNALKYGQNRPVELRLERVGDTARITVRDRGIGVAPQDMQRIFGRFERAASIRSFGGMGLGLYITKQIVEAHGGRITVESALGKGSTFVVEIPLATEA